MCTIDELTNAQTTANVYYVDTKKTPLDWGSYEVHNLHAGEQDIDVYTI